MSGAVENKVAVLLDEAERRRACAPPLSDAGNGGLWSGRTAACMHEPSTGMRSPQMPATCM